LGYKALSRRPDGGHDFRTPRDEVSSKMPSYLDLAVLGIVLVSALLSMMRGFSREFLAIASWVAAAAAAYYFYPLVVPYLAPYIHKEVIQQAAAATIVFFATLIVVSLFTVRLSDAILDSKIGALDRSLGFLFGIARGFLLAVVAFAIFSWLAPDKQQPEWVKNARTRPALTETRDRIVAMLPEDAAATIDGWVKSRTGSLMNEEPAEESVPPASPGAAAPAPGGAAPAPPKKPDAMTGSGPSAQDKHSLDALTKQNAPPPAKTPKQ
jgi:membrane protein required for colicin V production